MTSKTERLVLSSGGHYMTENDVPGFTIYRGEPPADLVARTAAFNKFPSHGDASVECEFSVVGCPDDPQTPGV